MNRDWSTQVSWWSRPNNDLGDREWPRPEEERENLRLGIEQSLSVLRGQIERLNNKYRDMLERNKVYFEKCIDALVAKDEDRARIYAQEIAEIRRLANIVLHGQLVLLQVRIRLETIVELSEVIGLMKPLGAILETVRAEISDVVPEASESLRSLALTIEDFMTASGTYVEPVQHNPPEQSNEVTFVLEEAKKIAAEKVKQNFPDVPTLTEVERSVYSHLIASQKNELDMEDLCSELGLDRDTLTNALGLLQEKGLIELQVAEAS